HGRRGVPPGRGGEILPVGEARLPPLRRRGLGGPLRVDDGPRLPGGQARAALPCRRALAASAVPKGRPGVAREGGVRRRPSLRPPGEQSHGPRRLCGVVETAPPIERAVRSAGAACLPPRAARLAPTAARS